MKFIKSIRKLMSIVSVQIINRKNFATYDNFDEETYLRLNPDVAAAIESGQITSGREHFFEFGVSEGRLSHNIAGEVSEDDHLLHMNPQTQRPNFIDHEHIWAWLSENFNKKSLKVLEIGSRAVSSDSLWRKALPDVDYVGFDIQSGINVDVVGDVHFLSKYFAPQSFDLVISFAVFEHIALPWVAAEEISKVLKVGGVVALETHFSFSEHELPWHFFQFNSRALELLFAPEMGFETLDLGMSSPIVGRFSQEAAPYLRGKLVRDLYCHSSFAGRKLWDYSDGLHAKPDWRTIAERLSVSSSYPMESDIFLRRNEGPE